MIRRVFERASSVLDDVVIATDDQRIFDHVNEFGRVFMTSENHQSGTDRCAEAVQLLDQEYDYVINIQGDEPFLDPAEIAQVMELLNKENGNIEILTLAFRLEDNNKINDPNVVKVVINHQGNALYFSRSPIPYRRNQTSYPVYQHVGLYVYRNDILKAISNLPPSMLEKTESLEQLRWMDGGYQIKVLQAAKPGVGIDTPEDLRKALDSKLWQTS